MRRYVIDHARTRPDILFLPMEGLPERFLGTRTPSELVIAVDGRAGAGIAIETSPGGTQVLPGVNRLGDRRCAGYDLAYHAAGVVSGSALARRTTD